MRIRPVKISESAFEVQIEPGGVIHFKQSHPGKGELVFHADDAQAIADALLDAARAARPNQTEDS